MAEKMLSGAPSSCARCIKQSFVLKSKSKSLLNGRNVINRMVQYGEYGAVWCSMVQLATKKTAELEQNQVLVGMNSMVYGAM